MQINLYAETHIQSLKNKPESQNCAWEKSSPAIRWNVNLDSGCPHKLILCALSCFTHLVNPWINHSELLIGCNWIMTWERNPNPSKNLINTAYAKEDRHQGLEKQQSKAFLPYLQLPIRMYQDHMWPPCTLWSLQKVGSSSSSNCYSGQCCQGCCIIDVCINFPPEELGGAPHAVQEPVTTIPAETFCFRGLTTIPEDPSHIPAWGCCSNHSLQNTWSSPHLSINGRFPLVLQCAFTARVMQYFKLVQEKNFWDQHPFLHMSVWHHSWRTITLLVLYYTTPSTTFEKCILVYHMLTVALTAGKPPASPPSKP